MICPVCGANLDEDSVFCAVCGKPVRPNDSASQNEQDSMEHVPLEKESGSVNAEEEDAVKEGKEACESTEDDASDTPSKDSEPTGPVLEKKSRNEADNSAALSKAHTWRSRWPALAAGTLFILIGFWRILSAGASVSSTSFGADFYTYTYQGIVAVVETLVTIEVTLGWILVAIGTAINIVSLR